MTDTTDDNVRFDRISARANILIPAIKRMLDETGSTHEEVAATLRVHAGLVEGKVDPAEEAGNRGAWRRRSPRRSRRKAYPLSASTKRQPS